LVFRTITGLAKDEFAQSTKLVAVPLGMKAISSAKVDSMERKGTTTKGQVAQVVAKTLTRILDGSLFGRSTGDPHNKQMKPDTIGGWSTIRDFANYGVP
jgi:hypothetical protein